VVSESPTPPNFTRAPGPAPEPEKGQGRREAPSLPRWWGWGSGESRYSRERVQKILDFLRFRLGGPREGAGGPPPELHDLSLPPSRLSRPEFQRLRDLLSLGTASMEGEERLLHSFGKSSMDLLRLRHAQISKLTDVVVHPASVEEVQAVLAFAEDHDLAVVPWGGGTSVVGGVDPEEGSHRAVLTLSLARLAEPLSLDATSRLARFQCGIYGPEIERYLQPRGFTLGHFPQSFEYSTLGGWLSTRSSGQESSRYGDISQMVRGAKLVTPRGLLVWDRSTSEAAGPDLSEVFVGSEGTLGIFVEATMRVHPRPPESRWDAALLPDWYAALEFARELSQSDETPPSVLRVSDTEETALTLEGRAPSETLGSRFRDRLAPHLLDLKKLDPEAMCLAIANFQGTASSVDEGVRRFRQALRSHGGLDLGRGPGEAWKNERFALPYLRDELLSEGYFVETLETASSWSDLGPLDQEVKTALRDAAHRGKFPAFVAAHLSHTETTGSGLYYTLVVPQLPGREEEQWEALKRAATEAIVHHGGTLSHHHGVGRLHRPWVDQARGQLTTRGWRSLKEFYDPKGILNPGKVHPASR
jgi:alkyldihydroxyacetonephosphate synthase